MTDYKYSLKIRDKEIKFRKWKVKDKKNFIIALKANDTLAVENIVLDCLEDKTIPLTETEFKYVLLKIRDESIPYGLTFQIDCEECEKEFDYTSISSKLLTPNFKPYGEIKSGNVSFIMDEIQNKEYYIDAIRQCTTDEEKSFIDFLYHVKKVNGNDAFTFDTLYDFVNNMDIEIGEDIFKQWNDMNFTLDSVQMVTCPHCKHEQYIQFDELYGFFPDSWFE